VGDGGAEGGQDRVADELLHQPAVLFDGGHAAGEVAVHDLPQRFGIKPFCQRGGSHDIDE